LGLIFTSFGFSALRWAMFFTSRFLNAKIITVNQYGKEGESSTFKESLENTAIPDEKYGIYLIHSSHS